jgi:glycosyltransferase involved in cell wall biosynthesis
MMTTLTPRPEPATRSTCGLRGRDMLCFSHDWTGDPLSKTHLMRMFARDNRVLWINSIGYRTPSLNKADVSRAFRKLAALRNRLREVEPNLFVLNPIAIPAYGSPLVRRMNQRLLKWQIGWAMRRLGFRRPIDWVFNPAAAVVAGTLGEDAVIYYCVDEFSAFSGVATAQIAELEMQLIKKADAVVVSAEELYKTKAPLNPHTALVRHGVDFDHFRKALDPETVIPAEIRDLPKPIIGFFGLVADWVDLDLIAAAARRWADGTVVVLGKVTTDASRLESLPNVRLLGRKPYADLPAYCKGFDVALNPFRINRLTLNTNPLKVREYLAAGLPVVSTAIPEVERLGLCRVASTEAEFLAKIEAALANPGPDVARSETMREESWQAKVSEIAGHLREFGILEETV